MPAGRKDSTEGATWGQRFSTLFPARCAQPNPSVRATLEPAGAQRGTKHRVPSAREPQLHIMCSGGSTTCERLKCVKRPMVREQARRGRRTRLCSYCFPTTLPRPSSGIRATWSGLARPPPFPPRRGLQCRHCFRGERPRLPQSRGASAVLRGRRGGGRRRLAAGLPAAGRGETLRSSAGGSRQESGQPRGASARAGERRGHGGARHGAAADGQGRGRGAALTDRAARPLTLPSLPLLSAPFPQVVPGADPARTQLCFEWGPAEMLLCETLFGRRGGERRGAPGGSAGPAPTGCGVAGGGDGAPGPSRVFVVRRDQDIYMETLRKLFNESHGIFVGLQRCDEERAARARNAQ